MFSAIWRIYDHAKSVGRYVGAVAVGFVWGPPPEFEIVKAETWPSREDITAEVIAGLAGGDSQFGKVVVHYRYRGSEILYALLYDDGEAVQFPPTLGPTDMRGPEMRIVEAMHMRGEEEIADVTDQVMSISQPDGLFQGGKRGLVDVLQIEGWQDGDSVVVFYANNQETKLL